MKFSLAAPALITAILASATCSFAQTAEPVISFDIRDFAPRGFDYAYGPAWKLGENVKVQDDGVLIDTNEAGGVGLILNGKNIVPQNQTHLAVRAKVLEGNVAAQLQININGPGANKGVSLKLTQLKDQYQTLLIPLPAGDYSNVAQVQFQGTNWGGGNRVKVLIDKFGTTSLDEAQNKEAAAKQTQAIASSPSAGPAAKDKPAVPGWGFFPQYPDAWLTMHRGFNAATKAAAGKTQVPVVFLGDSLTQGWLDAGKETWNQRYKPLGALDYGIGGDSTRQILWRLSNGNLDGLNPRAVVIMIGTNNLYDDRNGGSESEIAEGVKAVVSKVKEVSPASKILLLGLLPRQNAWFSGRVGKINQILAQYAKEKGIEYLDMGPDFATAPLEGQVKPELFSPDKLHLSAAGYAKWHEVMWPKLEPMLKP